jgi:hypothetical protein
MSTAGELLIPDTGSRETGLRQAVCRSIVSTAWQAVSAHAALRAYRSLPACLAAPHSYEGLPSECMQLVQALAGGCTERQRVRFCHDRDNCVAHKVAALIEFNRHCRNWCIGRNSAARQYVLSIPLATASKRI